MSALCKLLQPCSPSVVLCINRFWSSGLHFLTALKAGAFNIEETSKRKLNFASVQVWEKNPIPTLHASLQSHWLKTHERVLPDESTRERRGGDRKKTTARVCCRDVEKISTCISTFQDFGLNDVLMKVSPTSGRAHV